MELHPRPQPNPWNFRRVMWATLVVLLVALGFWLLYRFSGVIFILFIAIVIGTVIRPVVNRLHRVGLPRIAGVLVVYLLLLALLIGFVLLLFPLIVEQGTTIAAGLPGEYEDLRQSMVDSPSPLIVRFSAFVPEALPGLEPSPQSGQQMRASAQQAWGYLTSAGTVVFVVAVILLLAFHWTLDGPRSIQSLLRLMPSGQREGLGELIAAMETKAGAYVAGQAVLCFIVGIMALAAYLLIGLPNALLLALVAGVMEAVPMIGPLLGAVPAAVIALSLEPAKLVWVIAATLVIQQLENAFLVPRVMGKAVGVNPFVSLLAIFAFSSLLGPVGVLMAIPTAAILQLLLDRFVFHPSLGEGETSAGRDVGSRLRYEARGLAQDLRKQARLTKSDTGPRVKQIDQVMDEIETIAADLDALLAQVPPAGAP